MIKFISTLLLSTLAWTLSASTRVQDEMGTFSIDYTPQKIVGLEYSFIDALATLDLSPVGIADDGKKESVITQISDKIDPWVFVASRSTPNLEIITSLKSDLIITDIERQTTIDQDLQKIAPTLILTRRGETYQDNLICVVKVAKAWTGNSARYNACNNTMSAWTPTPKK